MPAPEFETDTFIIALDHTHALNTLSVWLGNPGIRPTLEEGHIFDTPEPAHTALAAMKERAQEDGVCEPGHECGRCVPWPPHVYRLQVTITDTMS